ncbi:hypothetical protein EXU57_01630 [Segetibacter sp. 3557_3]|uniref:hypothetical protein n=1 Tax=Segetibacter sp. 3557_3 TaxID=2547429 RepID=UPI001058AF3E|nr:hypothetical protein [Segetibacter sp. 3557_3]TDH28797.1 hypothetical protein EXU57_01630 [Segetibacter sp. 3557_3]
MNKLVIVLAFLLCFRLCSFAQDTTVIYKNQSFQLSEVVVRNNFNIASFIEYVKNDTTFYKAFRNLRVLSFTSLNHIELLDKRGKPQAGLDSKTRQTYVDGCRSMQVLEEKSTGDFYDKRGNYNYTTAELYANLFFTRGTVCGENNIVKGVGFSTKGKSGIEKHKEQLKQLFFNPGKRIPGIPFIGNKVALFDEDVAALYDFKIDRKDYMGNLCYVFSITPRQDLSSGQRGDVVIDEMTTWFNAKNYEIIGRNYTLSYNAGVYDFDVQMEVQLEKVQDLWVPKVLRYKGYFDVVFKKKERALFTATLYDFQKQ